MDEISQVFAEKFLESPNDDNAIKLIKKLGFSFYKNIEPYVDINKILSAKGFIDLQESVQRCDYESGEKYLSENYTTRSLDVNLLQHILFEEFSPKLELHKIIEKNSILFNEPVVEKINGIDYEKNIVDFLFQNSEYNNLFSTLSKCVNSLNERQSLILATYLIKKHVEKNDNQLIEVLNEASDLEPFKKAIEITNKMQNPTYDMKQVNATILDITLSKKGSYTKKNKL